METNIMPILSFVLTAVGWCLHFTSKWAEYRDEVAAVGLGGYLSATPARTAMSVFGAIGAAGAAYGMGWLNPGFGLACGVAANSIVDNIVKRAQQ